MHEIAGMLGRRFDSFDRVIDSAETTIPESTRSFATFARCEFSDVEVYRRLVARFAIVRKLT